MADNFQITQGSGTIIAADEQIDGSYEQKIQVTNFPSSQAVTGPLTDTQLRATPVPVSGTVTATPTGTQTVSGSVSVSNFPATQPVSGTFFQVTQPVSGTFFQVTQPISAAALPLPSGAATEASLALLNAKLLNASLMVTATGAAAAAVTLTLPAVVSQTHNICLLEIEAYSTAARTGGVTPVIVTSTNLPGTPAWTFASAAAAGSTDTKLYTPIRPLVATAANTATTIVCPATASIIWRVNAIYYTV